MILIARIVAAVMALLYLLYYTAAYLVTKRAVVEGSHNRIGQEDAG